MKRLLIWTVTCAVILGTICGAWARSRESGFAAARIAEDHVVVKLRRGANSAGLGDGQRLEPLFGDWYLAYTRPGETAQAAVERLRRNRAVTAAELDYVLRIYQTPNDPSWPQQWNFPMVQAQAAWSLGNGSGVTVAVLDTGLSALANDFVASNILPYPSIYGTSNDLNGHGTHVAGTIAQATHNGIGAAGLAHGAKIRPVKVMSDSGTGYTSDIAAGVYGSALSGDKVINMSLGTGCTANWPACSALVLNDAIKEAVDRDVVLVAASGNDNAGFVSFPANHPNVIAVGAVTTTQARAWYSNQGCALSLAAPGGTTSPLPSGGIYQQTYFNGGVQVRPFQGTSMAAPHVAAAAAILRSKFPAASALQVRSALQASALDLAPTGRDNGFGHGLLKINDALTALQGGVPPLPPVDFCGNVRLVPNPPTAPNMVDLRVASIAVGGATVNPQTFQLGGTATVTVSNWATVAPAANYKITLFKDVNQDGQFLAAEHLTTFTCNAANCAITPFGHATFTIPLSGTLDFRDRRLSAFVDSQAQVVESSETNNIALAQGVCGASSPITIQPVQMWSTATTTTLGLGTPIVADLDQNGVAEVIFMDGAGPIRALSGATGLDAPFFTAPNLGSPGFFFDRGYTVAAANLDSDPFLEIVAAKQDTAGNPDNQFVQAFEHNGGAKWTAGPFQINVNTVNPSLPTIADLDHDGVPEVIAAGRILNGANGAVKAILNTGTGLFGGPAVAVNLDSDADLEVVLGNLAFNANGSPLWANPNPVEGFVAVVDFDGDGQPDILHMALGTTPTLRLYQGNNGTAHPGWNPPTLPAGAQHSGPPTVADVDGDGQPEVAVVAPNRLLVYRKDGSLYWQLPISENPGSQGVTAFDFNQDGAWELVLGDEGSVMIVADVGGAPVVVWSSGTANLTWHEYPAIADINGDGHAEIVFRTQNGGSAGHITAFRNANSDWPATRGIWNQYSYHAENVGPNGQIPVSLPANWWADNQFLVNPQPTPGGAGPDLTAGQLVVTANTVSAVIGNAGSAAASPLWVTFYDGPPGGGTVIGSVNLGSLAPGTSATASVAHALTGGHNIYVVADRDGAGAGHFLECNETNNVHNLPVTVPAGAEISIKKSVSSPVLKVGQPGFYTLQVISLSAANSSNTVVTDTLPAGLQIGPISYSPSSCPWTSSQSGQTLTFSRPSGIGAGQVCTITIGFTGIPGAINGTVTNVATLTDAADTSPVNNQASVTHQVVKTGKFDLTITKQAIPPANRGFNLIYFIQVTNLGPSPSTGLIEVTDTMNGGNGLIVFNPSTSGFQSVVNGGLWPVSVNPLGGPWTCGIVTSNSGLNKHVTCTRSPTAPPMAVGASEAIVLTARVDALAGAQATNTVAITASADSNSANNQAVRVDPVQ